MPKEPIEAKRLRLARKAKRLWNQGRHVRCTADVASLKRLAQLDKQARRQDQAGA